MELTACYQILGLLCQAIIGFIMSGLYTQLTEHIAAFAVVYGIFLSFGELGQYKLLCITRAAQLTTSTP